MSTDHHHDEHGDKLLESEDFQKARREMRRTLWTPGVRADQNVGITRRVLINRAVLGGAAAAATVGWLPRINTMDMAYAQEGGGVESFRFAWISDTHLYPKEVNTRFVEKAVRAVEDVKAMDPPPDFLIFGGDLAQLGDPVELKLGNEIINELKIKKYFIPGEHDWYLDMGKTWTELYGASPWTFDHKGVRFIGLDTVSRAADYWSAKNMSAEERMGHMSGLDGAVAGAWAGLGQEQLDYLDKTLSDWGADKPVVIFTHNPLYEYYPPWNFWVRDWREVHEIVKPYKKITNIHGHTHQVLYNEIGAMRSIGMLATSWPWPYAPEGVPDLTRPMGRVNPGDPFDGVGWGQISFDAETQKVDHQWMMWRKEVLAAVPAKSGTSDNPTTYLRARPDGR
jgi:predicted MPP superfamily phosphohydrolase